MLQPLRRRYRHQYPIGKLSLSKISCKLSAWCKYPLIVGAGIDIPSLVPRPHFSRAPAGKKVLVNCLFHFRFKCAGMLAHCSFLI